jgi:hypothetical protein
MKCLISLNFIIALSCLFFSCSSESEKAEQTTEIKAVLPTTDWSTNKRNLALAISGHYTENTYQKGQMSYLFKDMVAQKTIYLTLAAIQQDSIYPISGTRAFMRVDARTEKGDSLIFDYEVKATPAPEKADSMVYNVESLNLRKVNNEQRYILKKEGNFWVKEILAVAQ